MYTKRERKKSWTAYRIGLQHHVVHCQRRCAAACRYRRSDIRHRRRGIEATYRQLCLHRTVKTGERGRTAVRPLHGCECRRLEAGRVQRQRPRAAAHSYHQTEERVPRFHAHHEHDATMLRDNALSVIYRVLTLTVTYHGGRGFTRTPQVYPGVDSHVSAWSRL